MSDQVALYRANKARQRQQAPQAQQTSPLTEEAQPQSQVDMYETRKKEQREQRAKQAATKVQLTGNPDEHAADLKLAKEYQTHVNPEVTPPLSVVAKNRDRMGADIQRQKNSTVLGSSPMLTRWLDNEANARIAADDVPALAGVEAGLGHAKNALKRGVVDRFNQIDGQVSSGIWQYSAAQYGKSFMDRFREARGDLYGQGFLGRATTEPPRKADGSVDYDALDARGDGITSSLAQAAMGTVVDWANWFEGGTKERDVAHAVRTQQKAAEAVVSAQSTPVSPTAQRAMDALHSDEPLSLGEAVQRTLGLAVNDPGALAAMITEVGIESAGSIIPAAVVTATTRNPALGAATMGATSYTVERNLAPVEFFSERGYDLTKEEDVKRMLTNPALMQEAADKGHTRGLIIGALDLVSGGIAGKAMANNPLADAALQSAVQGVLGGAGEGFAQFATEGQVDYGEVIVEALAEFSTAPIDVAAIGARKLGEKRTQAQEAKRRAEEVQAMGEEAAKSKLRERSPEKFREFVENATNESDVETMYLPAEETVEYFQSQGLDIEQVAEMLPGVSVEQVKRAQATGEDIMMPTATYMETVAGSEVDQFVVDNSKFSPHEMTPAQARTYEDNAQLEEARVSAQQETHRAAQEAEKSVEETIANEVSDRLVKAGRPRVSSQHEAHLYSSFYKSLAKRTGQSIEDVLARNPLPEIRGAEVTPLEDKQVDNVTRDMAAMRERLAQREDATPTKSTTPQDEYLDAVEQSVRDAGLDPATATDEEARASVNTYAQKAIREARLTAAIRHNGKVYKAGKNGTHLDALEKITNQKERARAASDGENRGFTDERGRFLNRYKAQEYAVGLGLVSPNAPAWAWTSPELISENLQIFSQSDVNQTQTPEFKAWFGASQAVSESGEPLTVYHGTNANAYTEEGFEVFSVRGERPSAYFSSARGVAESYGEDVYEVHLKAENPLIVHADGSGWSSFDSGTKIGGADLPTERPKTKISAEDMALLDELFADMEATGLGGDVNTEVAEQSSEEGTLGVLGIDYADIDAIADKARDMGFDSLVVRDVKDGPVSDGRQTVADTWVVFDPTNVKSATDNEGTFDPNDPSIYKQEERGRITIPKNGVQSGATVIDLFKNADLSTFLHESSHFFLSVLQEETARPDATPEVKAMYDQAKTWWRSNTKELAREASKVTPREGLAQDTSVDPTQTPEFKEWFGDSKVVDANGEPLTVYHGTRSDFEVFDGDVDKTIGRRYGEGFYFTNSQKRADSFADGRNGNVMPVYVKVENPFTGFDQLSEEQKDTYLHSEKEVSETLKDLGFDGRIINNDKYEIVAFYPEQIKSVNNRGTFDANDPRILYQDGDQKGTSKVTEQHITDYLDNGTTGNAATDHQVDVAMQEHFARAFETYLMEGKAPTNALRAAFENFRAWLMEVYKKVRGDLNVEVNDDIRQVFDMLLASDEEIALASEDNLGGMLATTAEEMGIAEEDYKHLAKLHQEAQDQTAAHTIQAAMKPIKQMRDAKFAARREEIRAEVETEVNARPVYRAIEWMGNKRWIGAEEQPKIPSGMRLNKEQLVERYGVGVLRTLPRGSFRVYTPAGMDIDEAAGWFGFATGDELVQAMEQTPKRKEAIANETDQRVMAELSKDDSISSAADEATQAFHNDKQGAYIAAELRTLHKATGNGNAARTSTASYARQIAKRTLAGLKARDAVASNRYLAAERKAAEQAQAAFAQGDKVKAADFKRKQLFNHMMFTESRRIADEVGKTERLAKRLSSKGTRKNLAVDYLGAIDDVLEQYDFRKSGTGKENSRERMLAYVEMMKEAGRENEIAIPQHILENAKSEPYMTLTVERVRGVYATLKNIEHTARRAQKLTDAQNERDMTQVVNDIADAFADNVKAKPPGRFKSASEGRRNAAREFANLVLTPDTLLREVDGFENGGSAYTHVKESIDIAGQELAVRREETSNKFEELYSVYSNKERNQMAVSKFQDSIGMSATKWELISIALNMGNSDNIQRLTDPKVQGSFKHEQLDAVIASLDERDVKFVQSMWDFIDSFYDEIAAREKRVKGVAPQKVQAQELVTPYGVLKGGYYPLKYDPRNAQGKQVDETHEDLMTSLKGGRFAAAQTRSGHVEARGQSSGKLVMLDMSVAHAHVNSVLHDLALSEPVTNAWRLLDDQRVKSLFYDSGKQVDHQTLQLWLQDVASGPVSSSHIMQRAAGALKTNYTISKLAFAATTVAVQVTGIAQSMVVIGKRNFAHGFLEYIKEPMRKADAVKALSPFMEERQNTYQKDIYDVLRDQEASPTKRKTKAVQNFFTTWGLFAMMKTQFYLVDMPTWLGAYRKAMLETGGDEVKSQRSADKMVGQAQASGLFQDRSAIERGTISMSTRQDNFVRLLTLLGSYMFAKGNIAYEQTRKTNFRDPMEAMTYTTNMMLIFTLEAVAYNLIKGTLPGMGGDDEEDVGEEWAKFLAKETALSVMGTMPGVRDLTSVVEGFDGGGAYGSILTTIGKPLVDALDGELDKSAIKNAVNASGLVLRVPASQANRVIDAEMRRNQGEEVSPIEYIMGKR